MKKCIICHKPVFSENSKYCVECHRLYKRMHIRRFSPEAVEGFWDFVREHGKVCYFTRMRLDLDNPDSPWYLVFDHWIPRNGTKIVPTSALLNGMKSVLLIKEFWGMVDQLNNNHRTGKPIRKKKFSFWGRFYAQRLARLQAHDRLCPHQSACPGCGPVLRLSDGSLNPILKLLPTKGKCFICNKRLSVKDKDHCHPIYCPRCSRFARRIDNEMLPPATVKRIIEYVRKYGFVCYYTKTRLDMDNPRSPWYLVFDRLRPHDDRKVVLTFALLNEMKLDMTEKEFWFMVRQLADFKRKGTAVRKIRLRFWHRLVTKLQALHV